MSRTAGLSRKRRRTSGRGRRPSWRWPIPVPSSSGKRWITIRRRRQSFLTPEYAGHLEAVVERIPDIADYTKDGLEIFLRAPCRGAGDEAQMDRPGAPRCPDGKDREPRDRRGDGHPGEGTGDSENPAGDRSDQGRRLILALTILLSFIRKKRFYEKLMQE